MIKYYFKDRKHNKNNRFIRITPFCISIYIILTAHFNLISYAETSKIDTDKHTRLTELQEKINELNASLAALNNQDKASNTEKAQINDNTNGTESTVLPQDTGQNIQTSPTSPDIQPEKIKPADITREEKQKENKQNIESTAKGNEYSKEKRKTDWIISTINNGTHKDRKYAINLILTIKDPGLKKELGAKLIEIIKNEAELEVKVKAITVAGEIKLNEAVPFLVDTLHDETDDVSVAAVYAIKRIGDLSTKPALIARLREQKFESNTNLTEALIDTLGEFKAAELTSFASEIINDINTDQIIRELLVLFLGKTESREPKELLLSLLNDEDEKEQIRAFSANSLANLKITEAVPDITKVIQTIDSYSFNKKKKYYNLYIYCIAALAKLGDEKAYPLLINALRSDNAVIRLKAVTLIKSMKDKRSIDILKYKMQYDPSQKVQSAAKEALKELGVDVDSLKKEDIKNEQNQDLGIKKEEQIKKDIIDEPSAE